MDMYHKPVAIEPKMALMTWTTLLFHFYDSDNCTVMSQRLENGIIEQCSNSLLQNSI